MDQKKEVYEQPVLEIIVPSAADIATESVPGDDGTGEQQI